jgi:hypothetical protein
MRNNSVLKDQVFRNVTSCRMTVADVSKTAMSSSLGSSSLTVLTLLSLRTPCPRRHEDLLKLRGNHSPKYTISYLWKQIFSNTAIRTSHIRYLGPRNRQSPELGTNTENYRSTFTQPPCIQTVTGKNLDRYIKSPDGLSWFSQSFPSPIIPSLDATWQELRGKSN